MSDYQVTNYGMCEECRHQYLMVYRTALKCMNEESEFYGEDVDVLDTCDMWEQRGIE